MKEPVAFRYLRAFSGSPPPHPAPQVLQQKETSWALNEVVMLAIVQ